MFSLINPKISYNFRVLGKKPMYFYVCFKYFSNELKTPQLCLRGETLRLTLRKNKTKRKTKDKNI